MANNIKSELCVHQLQILVHKKRSSKIESNAKIDRIFRS